MKYPGVTRNLIKLTLFIYLYFTDRTVRLWSVKDFKEKEHK